MNQQRESGGTGAIRHLRDGLVTMGVLLLAFAAFDDITTDNAVTFRFEYTMLIACAGWLLFLGLSLLRQHDYALGAVSWLALAGAAWAQRAIGPGMTPGLRPEYVAATAAYLWFVALSCVLLWRGWSGYSARPRQSA